MPETNNIEGAKVLLVDDDPMLLRLVSSILEQAGCRVVAVQSGEEALTEFESRISEFSLLVSDIEMPGLNGFDLADRICELDRNIRVLFIWGFVKPTLEKRGALRDGFNFLEKPFNPVELLDAVSAALIIDGNSNVPAALKGK